MAFTNTWDDSYPDGSTLDAGQLDDAQNRLRVDVRERLVLEHLFPLDATDGVHRASGCAVLAADTTANLYTAPLDKYELGGTNGAGNVTGSISYDTTLNCMCYYNGSAAIPITPRKVGSDTDATAQTIADTTWTTITGLSAAVANVIVGELLHITVQARIDGLPLGESRAQMQILVDGVAEGKEVSIYGGGTFFAHNLFTATATSHTVTIKIYQNGGATEYYRTGEIVVIAYPVI